MFIFLHRCACTCVSAMCADDYNVFIERYGRCAIAQSFHNPVWNNYISDCMAHPVSLCSPSHSHCASVSVSVFVARMFLSQTQHSIFTLYFPSVYVCLFFLFFSPLSSHQNFFVVVLVRLFQFVTDVIDIRINHLSFGLFLAFRSFIHSVDGLSKQCSNHFEAFFAYHYHFCLY